MMKSACLEQVCTDLSDGYGRIQRSLGEPRSDGERQVWTVVGNAKRAIDESSPTWLPSDIASALQAQLRVPAAPSDLLAAGPQGLLVFEESVTNTALGAKNPTTGAPVNGLIWWPARIDDADLRYDVDEPELLVLHVLSTELGIGFPWPGSLWGPSTLTDIGMFALPLHQELVPPGVGDDDLAPAIATVLGFGAAVSEGRLIFDAVPGESPATRAVGCRPRAATVLAA